MVKEPENRIKMLNQTILARCIPHGNFQVAFDRAMDLMSLRDWGMRGSGMFVYGNSGVGKTTLTKSVCLHGTKRYGEDSVIRTQLTTGSTIKSILSGLLIAFGDPLASRSSTDQLEKRLAATILERKCRLIIIDEIQHLIPGGKPSKTLIDTILNSFKILDDTGVSFLLSGMETAMLLWNADEQLRSRFETHHYLSHFTYPKDRNEWGKVVRKYVKNIEEYGMHVECSQFEDRCHAATSGAMRQLVLILTTAVVEAYKSKSDTITSEHLHKAALKQIDKQDGFPDAFNVELEKVTQFSRYKETSRSIAPVERGMGGIFAK